MFIRRYNKTGYKNVEGIYNTLLIQVTMFAYTYNNLDYKAGLEL